MPKKHYGWQVGDVLPTIGPHSLAKHRILKHYIKRYVEILTALSVQEQLNITFVDGYAGGGRYAYGAETVPGSPLILLHAIAEAEALLDASRTKGFRINAEFVFIDNDAKHVEFLREEIRKVRLPIGLIRRSTFGVTTLTRRWAMQSQLQKGVREGGGRSFCWTNTDGARSLFDP